MKRNEDRRRAKLPTVGRPLRSELVRLSESEIALRATVDRVAAAIGYGQKVKVER